MVFRNKLSQVLATLLLLMISSLVGCNNIDSDKDVSKNNINNIRTNRDKEPVNINKNLEVHYIDVEQGDAILIKQGDSNMLIDSGDTDYGETVVSYLKSNNISHLDYVIATHPHSDHIGGMKDVINTFDIDKIIMPDVTLNIRAFEELLIAITNKGMKITTPIVGDKYKLGDSTFTILAPNSDFYNGLNDYSIITKLIYGNNSFMFTGDADKIAESETVAAGYNLKSDVLKLGHHGSYASTTPEFLQAVDPKYAVVQVGYNNYGYLAPEHVEKLQNNNIDLYRTDRDGNIIATSDGNTITFETKPSEFSIDPQMPTGNRYILEEDEVIEARKKRIEILSENLWK